MDKNRYISREEAERFSKKFSRQTNEFVIEGIAATHKGMSREVFQEKFLAWLSREEFIFSGMVGQFTKEGGNIPDSCLIQTENPPPHMKQMLDTIMQYDGDQQED